MSVDFRWERRTKAFFALVVHSKITVAAATVVGGIERNFVKGVKGNHVSFTHHIEPHVTITDLGVGPEQ